jgi:hypothetical protein
MKHLLAGIIGDRHRQVIHAVVDEIMADGSADVSEELMPIVSQPAAYLIHERIKGHGGMTQERALGEEGKAINAGGSETRSFLPGSYQEHVVFRERDLLMLRKMGSIGDRGATNVTAGELDHLGRAAAKLKLRVRNRIAKGRWDAIFNGTYVYQGNTFSFGVPNGNRLTAGTDWSDKAAGKPLADLYALQTTYGPLLKYSIMEFIMNPKTAADAMKTDEVRECLKNYNISSGDLNTVAKLLYPGLAPIRIVKDVYQEEDLVDGEIVTGNAQFFVPNDKVLIRPDFSGSMYGTFGEYDITENINDPSATLDSPAVGIYTFVDEQGLAKKKAPHVDVVAGFNGAPNLLRSDDVFTVSV